MAYTKTNLNETTETVAVDMAAEDIENDETTETVAEQNARGYSKTVWNESTPITADKLNKMETGIANGIDKTEQIMEIPINHPDGWQQFRWTKPGATTISWTRDVSRRKAFEVYDENAYKPLLLLNDDGVLTTSGNLVSQGNLAFSNYGGGGLSSNIHSLALHAATGNGQLMNVGSGNTIYVGNPNTQLTIESSSNPIVNIGPNVYQLYHTGNKPTAGDVGALPITGGTLTGDLSISGYSKKAMVGAGPSDVYLHNSASGAFLQLKDDGLLRYNNNIIYHEGNFNPGAKLDAGAFSIHDRDLRVHGKRALVGFNTADGDYLSINYDRDFAAGVRIQGLLRTEKIEAGENLTFSNAGGSGLTATISNSTLHAKTGNGQMMNVGDGKIFVGNPQTSLALESSSHPTLFMGGGTYYLYHTGNKPTPWDIGAMTTSNPTFNGNLNQDGPNGHNWIYHINADRGTLNIAPKVNGNPDWGKQIFIDRNGQIHCNGNRRVATINQENPAHHIIRYGAGMGGENGYITFSW